MAALFLLAKLLLKIAAAPVVAALFLVVWLCSGIVFLSGLVLGLVSHLLLAVAVLIWMLGPVRDGVLIYLALAFLASPHGLLTAAFWLLGRVQVLRYLIQDRVYR